MPVAMFLDAAVGLFKRFRWLLPVTLMVLALGIQTWRLNHVKHALTQARATIAQMELASKQAAANQARVNADNQELSQRIATDAIVRHDQIAAAADAAIAAYKRDNGLRSVCPRIASGAGSPAVHGDSQAPSGTQAAAGLVAVSGTDLDRLAKAAMHDSETTSFLIDQVNAGLAVVR